MSDQSFVPLLSIRAIVDNSPFIFFVDFLGGKVFDPFGIEVDADLTEKIIKSMRETAPPANSPQRDQARNLMVEAMTKREGLIKQAENARAKQPETSDV